MPGSNVPVVVGVTGNGTALQRLAGCPHCRADRNLDGVADTADLLDFLDQYFTDPVTSRSVQNLLGYLQIWFAGC
jgi:hypothetical protein